MKQGLIKKLKVLRIYASIRSAYQKMYCWSVKITCKHKLTTEIFRCYQDRYVKEQCNACNKEFYLDL